MKQAKKPEPAPATRRISVAEARELCLLKHSLITWRPDPTLDEAEQYCLLRT